MDSAKYKNVSDKDLKDQGNKQFAARNFDEAINSYTLAIMKNSNVPHYYTNRALCYLNQKRWPQAVQDARQALEKDPNLVKGHFYLGKYLDGFFNYVLPRQGRTRELLDGGCTMFLLGPYVYVCVPIYTIANPSNAF